MSLFPCDRCHRRVRGPLATAYFTVMLGADRFSRRMRLCSDDLNGVLHDQASFLALLEADDLDAVSSMCDSCDSAFDGATRSCAAFATLYRPKSDRQDYFARLCVPCGQAAIEGLNLAL